MSRQAVIWGLLGVVALFVGLGVYRGYGSNIGTKKNKIAVPIEKNITDKKLEKKTIVATKPVIETDMNKTESVQKAPVVNTTPKKDIKIKESVKLKSKDTNKTSKVSNKKVSEEPKKISYDFSKSIFSEKKVTVTPPSKTEVALKKIIEGKPKYKQQTLKDGMKKAGVVKGDRVFIRIFKKERILELWMKGGDEYRKVYTYPICAYSGKLGPKQKEGDKQSPEGFYSVPYGKLNPNSHYHLSFNLGYPNEYDRAHGRSGSYLMVHGKCASVGCYAMTDSKIEEIYGMVESALLNGQSEVSVHIFPFKMTRSNINKYKNSKWYSFWLNLKQGYDMFEKNHIPPSVYVADKRYIFD